MTSPRCPGQDMRYWRPEDIFEIHCPFCEAEIEFWKDEPLRVCPGCQREIRNPRIDLGCAKWCKHAKDCLGALPESAGEVNSLAERVRLLLEGCLHNHPQGPAQDTTILQTALEAATIRAGAEDVDPLVLTLGTLLATLIHIAPQIAGFHPDPDWDTAWVESILSQAHVEEEAATATCNAVKAVCLQQPDLSPTAQRIAESVAAAQT